MNNHIEIAGRLSQIKSDGYVDRATANLKSYFLQAAYVDENTLVKAVVFGGQENTYLAWNGIEDLDVLESALRSREPATTESNIFKNYRRRVAGGVLD